MKLMANNKSMVKDSDDFMRKVNMTPIPAGYKFMKIDIKDFFMSGRHRRIMQILYSNMSTDDEEQRIALKLIEFVLMNQYVRPTNGAGKGYQVVTGTGMGLICAGEISDFLFHRMVEKPLIENVDVKERLNIRLWSRFKDDIFIAVGGDMQSRKSLWKLLVEKSEFFELKLETISSNSAVMLDMEVFKGLRWVKTRKLDVRLFKKPTSQWTPLSFLSAHAPGIHGAWPKAMIKRLRDRHTSKTEAENAVLKFREDLVGAWGEIPVNTVLDDLKDMSNRKPHDTSFKNETWMVLPWCPLWRYARITSRIREAEVSCGIVNKTRVSWCNSRPNVGLEIESYNKEYLPGYSDRIVADV